MKIPSNINFNSTQSRTSLDDNSLYQLPKRITVKSGLQVNTTENEWKLLPNLGKGHTLKIGWVRNGRLSDLEMKLTLLVYVHYAVTMSASTTVTVMYGTRDVISNGFPSLTELKIMWNKLSTSKKKATNQFFGTLKELGYSNYSEYYEFTTNHLDKNKIEPLHPQKGRLNDFEFNSISKYINIRIAQFDWNIKLSFSHFIDQPFKEKSTFTVARTLVSQKLTLETLRRPLQIAMLKWSDITSVGCSFGDKHILEQNEVFNIGNNSLQLRLFHVKKSKKDTRSRTTPEKYPMVLSEEISRILYKYKNLYAEGLFLTLTKSGINVGRTEIPILMHNMPIFPEVDFFSKKFSSLDEIITTFTPHSLLYHLSEAVIRKSIVKLNGDSDRVKKLNVNSNRLRHTALTRGAEQGLSSAELARLTGVTEPATRHYIDLDYRARELIDRNYLANQFLKDAFNVPIKRLEKNIDNVIYNSEFIEIGDSKSKLACNNCLSKMGRPIACYGCPNFRPILDANHRSVLEQAEAKMAINSKQITGPIKNRSIEKLARQIENIKITIAFCDEILRNGGVLNAE